MAKMRAKFTPERQAMLFRRIVEELVKNGDVNPIGKITPLGPQRSRG